MQIRIDWKIAIFVLFFFIKNTEYIYLLCLIFIIIHEISHIIAGIIVGFDVAKLDITPFGCHIDFKIKINNYNKKLLKGTICSLKKIVVSMAGPITNLLIVLLFCNIPKYEIIVYINLILAIFNILPVYPLDGGRIVKNSLVLLIGRRKALKYIDLISNIFLLILLCLCLVSTIKIKNPIFLLGIGYLVFIRIKEHKKYLIKEKVYRLLEIYK